MQASDFIRLTFVIFVVMPIFSGWAKVDPPNYNFSLDELAPLYPGNSVSDLPAKFQQKELVLKNGAYQTHRVYASQLRYKFPVLIQEYNGKITDMHAALPSYFLHDIFHQSLINRNGKQDRYFKKEEQAVYLWNNKNGNKHVYAGACTITCFPLFYNISTVEKPTAEFVPILERLKKSEL